MVYYHTCNDWFESFQVFKIQSGIYRRRFRRVVVTGLALKPRKLLSFWSIWGFLSCFTLFLNLGDPCLLNYNVSAPFGVLSCFTVFLDLGCPCPVNYDRSAYQNCHPSGNHGLKVVNMSLISMVFVVFQKHRCKT